MREILMREMLALRRVRSRGFTLLEMIISTAVMVVVLATVVSLSGREWRRERLNAVAIELAGWLEAIRTASTRQPGSNPCVVTFSTATSAVNGSVLATVAPASCSPQSSFTIKGIAGSTSTFQMARTPSTPSTVSFSPRGSISASSDTDLRILLAGTGQMRCVRLTGTVGLIRLGSRSDATDTSVDCSSYTVF